MRATSEEAKRRGWIPETPEVPLGATSFSGTAKDTPRHVRRAQNATERLIEQMRMVSLPPPTTEYRFDEFRGWRFDFAWPDHMLAVEFEGGVFTDGGHTRGEHYTEDCEKYNTAALLGWTVLRFTITHINSGEARRVLEEVFQQTVFTANPKFRISEWRKPRPKPKKQKKNPNGNSEKHPGKAGKEAKSRPGPRAIPGDFKPFEPDGGR
jgi:very-short-patch-repair endonuclease